MQDGMVLHQKHAPPMDRANASSRRKSPTLCKVPWRIYNGARNSTSFT